MRRVAWIVFAAEVLGIFAYALTVHLRQPMKEVSAAVTGPARTRFGKSEDERKRIFRALTAGEPADRREAAGANESQIWNRNRDSYFHYNEWGRLRWVAAQHRLSTPLGYLILDEGFRNHWPVDPGVEVYADDRPLAPVTRPLAQRRRIVP